MSADGIVLTGISSLLIFQSVILILLFSIIFFLYVKLALADALEAKRIPFVSTIFFFLEINATRSTLLNSKKSKEPIILLGRKN